MPIEPFSRFAKDEDGAVAIIVALLLIVLLGFTALGVDVASLYRQRAQLQNIGDLTAVSAMAVPGAPTPRAEYVLSRNGKTAEAIKTLETGRFLRNPVIPAADRFTVLPLGGRRVNAVRVVVQDDAPLFFARIFSGETNVKLDRTALATRTGSASFSLDSYLFALNGATLNDALKSQLGASAMIDTGAAQVLADTSVNLGDLLAALDTAAGGPRRNPADILNVTTTGATLVTALRSLLPSNLANDLAGLNAAAATASFDVASLVGGIDTDLGLTASEFLAQIDVSALDVVRAIINANAAKGTIKLTAGINVAGVLSTQTSMTAGEPIAKSGVIALGEEGTQLHRAAVRLRTDLAIAPNLLTGLGPSVRVVSINVPIYTEIAGATATLDQLGCNITSPQDIAASFITAANPLNPANGTAVAALYLGELNARSGPINPADLGFADVIVVDITIDLGLLPSIKLSGLTIQARSKVMIGASLADTVAFTIADVANGDTVKSFGSGTLVSSAVNSLLSPANTEFRVKPSQSGLVSGPVAPIVSSLLAALPNRVLAGLAAPIDTALDATLARAGLELGAGELMLIGHHCETIQLVR